MTPPPPRNTVRPRTPRFKKRRGFTLIEVAFSMVIILLGTIGITKFFNQIYGDLDPRGSQGGLRRSLMAEEMLKAQGEGLRVLRTIPLTDAQCKLITEPAGMGYSMKIKRTPGASQPNEQLYYYDLEMYQGNDPKPVATLSMSTLRSIGAMEGQDEKIGL